MRFSHQFVRERDHRGLNHHLAHQVPETDFVFHFVQVPEDIQVCQEILHLVSVKRNLVITWACVAALVAMLCGMPCAHGQAVVTGHYIPGFAGGLDSGILPPVSGFYLQNSTYYYHATTFRDSESNLATVAPTAQTVLQTAGTPIPCTGPLSEEQ